MQTANQIFDPTTQKFVIRKQVTTVYLRHSDTKEHMFWCPNCRNAILQYQGEVVQLLPGLGEGKFPIIVQCNNMACKQRYYFFGFIYEGGQE